MNPVLRLADSALWLTVLLRFTVRRPAALPLLVAVLTSAFLPAALSQSADDMQAIGRFEIDRTEVTIGQFQRFVDATGTVTAAEKAGGGVTFEGGWQRRDGWTWRTPYGTPGAANEPAVHIDYHEATRYCRWAGKRLPSDTEWGEAAYVERRARPSDGFVNGRSYRYPTGDTPTGANCLGDCGPTKVVSNTVTSRGRGHAPVGTTKPGVNGLFDMAANVWEWVDSGPGEEKRTRGGSWWYGAGSMTDDHVQGKPASMSAIYIGFRCARDLANKVQ